MLVDKKFVFTALIIGFVYASMVLLVNKLIGKEAAGIVAIALTAIATSIFKQFEKLKFGNDAPETKVIKYAFRWGNVLVIAFLSYGMSVVLTELIEPYIATFFGIPNSQLTREDFQGTWSISIYSGYALLKADLWGSAIYCLSFLISGYLSARCLLRTGYAEIIAGSLLCLVLIICVEEFFGTVIGESSFSDLYLVFSSYTYSYLYIVFASIGVYFANLFKDLSQKSQIKISKSG